MPSALTISLVQTPLAWENKRANLQMLEEKLKYIPSETHIVVLPEMFTTGFSMQPKILAEPIGGESIEWMKQQASTFKKIITGSIIIKDNNQFYNRLIWMMPNGQFYHYDKRHLFAYADEDKHYTAGTKKLIVQVNGWKICPFICYDLRFPVWARQGKEPYDILMYVANWPERRSLAWNTLLKARAIENQSFVIGVNRVGDDGKQIHYSGDSQIIDPLGNSIISISEEERIITHTFDYNLLSDTRKQFPFLNDADGFVLA